MCGEHYLVVNSSPPTRKLKQKGSFQMIVCGSLTLWEGKEANLNLRSQEQCLLSHSPAVVTATATPGWWHWLLNFCQDRFPCACISSSLINVWHRCIRLVEPRHRTTPWSPTQNLSPWRTAFQMQSCPTDWKSTTVLKLAWGLRGEGISTGFQEMTSYWVLVS